MRITPLILVLALALAACFQPQHATGADVSALECATCHIDLYNANPTHPGQKPTTCADCHNTTNWNAAGHPEAAFPIASGPHTNIACATCHDASLGSPVKGANTNCIQCHKQPDMDPKHVGVGGYAYSNTKKNFCLTCHPTGSGASHPENPFPIKNSNHSGIACATCHNPARGSVASQNIDCYGSGACHSDSHNYTPATPARCFSCHPSGFAGN
jgi:formate-dependent nitrite reductase cytochrome c552 subunit